MKLKWMENLVLFLFLLGTKTARFPGPTTNEPEDLPSRNFSCSRKLDLTGPSIEISTEAVNIPWISQETRGISIQKVTSQDGQYFASEVQPVRSVVNISIVQPNRIKVQGATSELQERLTHGNGEYALVTSRANDNVLNKESQILIEGNGSGKWKIRQK